VGITIDVYSPTRTLKQAGIALSADRTFFDHLSDTGAFKFKIGLEDPVLALIDYDDKIILKLDGSVRFGGVVETLDENPVDQGEEAAEVSVVGGRGNALQLDWAKVYPEFGITRRTPDQRPFDWTASAFDDSAWAAAVSIQTGQSSDGPWPGNPDGWPDAAARWLWSQAMDGSMAAPNGDAYFRRPFSLSAPEAGRFAIFITADDGYELWIDGARISGELTAFMFNSTRRVDVDLDAGDHIMAIHGRNEFGGAAGVIMTMLRTTNGGRDLGVVVLHTDVSWKAIGYPPQAPGMTPGRIMRVLTEEAIARGMWANDAGMTLAFSDTVDSAGIAWGASINPTFAVGATYLDVLRQIAEFGFDWHMDPTMNTLRLWNGEGIGTDAVTVLARSVNLLSLTRQGSTEGRANVLLSRYRGRGSDQQGWLELTDPGGSAAVRRREQFLSAGTQDESYVRQLAAASFESLVAPSEAITAEPIERPDASGDEHCRAYVDYGLGDWIHAPDRAGASTRYRVKGITITEDAEGNVTSVPELSSIRMEFAERLQRWVRRMVPGTLEGSSESASPPPPPPAFDSPVDVPPATGDLVDFSSDPFPDGFVPAWDPGLGEFVPTDPGSFGGGGLGGGMTPFAFPGPLGVGRSVGQQTTGGDATTVYATLAVAGTTATTFTITVRDPAGPTQTVVGTFTFPANQLEHSFDWTYTFASGVTVWAAVTVPGSVARGLGIQIS